MTRPSPANVPLARTPLPATPRRPIGILANPASGKDIRRLATHASVFDNREKCAILARCLAGIQAVAPAPIVYFDDAHGIAGRAVARAGLAAKPLSVAATNSAADTTRAAAAMRTEGCAAVITLGGDGTNRAFAAGWPDATLLPLSTGTNNAFPHLGEATAAGMAAALTACEAAPLATIAQRCKMIHVQVEGQREHVALIDAAITSDRFVGARALLNGERLRKAVLTRAAPGGMGLSGIGGMLRQVREADDCGLVVEFAAPERPARCRVRAAIAPGCFQDFDIASAHAIALGERIALGETGVLALDGERERPLRARKGVAMTVRRDGPYVIDIERALATLTLPEALLDVRHAV